MALSVSYCLGTEVQVFRILVGAVRDAVEGAIQAICGFASCVVVEMNVQRDHVHVVLILPPKVSVSESLGRLKGRHR